MTKVCPCGRGKVSAHDGKCGNCRTNREKRELDRKLNPPWTLARAFENITGGQS